MPKFELFTANLPPGCACFGGHSDSPCAGNFRPQRWKSYEKSLRKLDSPRSPRQFSEHLASPGPYSSLLLGGAALKQFNFSPAAQAGIGFECCISNQGCESTCPGRIRSRQGQRRNTSSPTRSGLNDNVLAFQLWKTGNFLFLIPVVLVCLVASAIINI